MLLFLLNLVIHFFRIWELIYWTWLSPAPSGQHSVLQPSSSQQRKGGSTQGVCDRNPTRQHSTKGYYISGRQHCSADACPGQSFTNKHLERRKVTSNSSLYTGHSRGMEGKPKAGIPTGQGPGWEMSGSRYPQHGSAGARQGHRQWAPGHFTVTNQLWRGQLPKCMPHCWFWNVEGWSLHLRGCQSVQAHSQASTQLEDTPVEHDAMVQESVMKTATTGYRWWWHQPWPLGWWISWSAPTYHRHGCNASATLACAMAGTQGSDDHAMWDPYDSEEWSILGAVLGLGHVCRWGRRGVGQTAVEQGLR